MKNEMQQRVMEPELEILARDMDPAGRRTLARKFRGWARDLEVSACIMEDEAKPRGKRKLRRLRPEQLARN